MCCCCFILPTCEFTLTLIYNYLWNFLSELEQRFAHRWVTCTEIEVILELLLTRWLIFTCGFVPNIFSVWLRTHSPMRNMTEKVYLSIYSSGSHPAEYLEIGYLASLSKRPQFLWRYLLSKGLLGVFWPWSEGKLPCCSRCCIIPFCQKALPTTFKKLYLLNPPQMVHFTHAICFLLGLWPITGD